MEVGATSQELAGLFLVRHLQPDSAWPQRAHGLVGELPALSRNRVGLWGRASSRHLRGAESLMKADEGGTHAKPWSHA